MTKELYIGLRIASDCFDYPNDTETAIAAATQLFEQRMRTEVDKYLAGHA